MISRVCVDSDTRRFNRARRGRVQVFDDAGGVADSDAVGGDITGDDGAGSDDRVFADGDARAYDDGATQPRVILDGDRG